ncbi:phage head-tail connector protein [Anaerosinus massiliensis]|uniref:phage head-tail connector protein n=1 Tax=Massilibacillus massiliensis TaxID=1806837 RepID=UPI000DA5FD02|nr:phage head-tail connector protein [Massilibacillus massiliensis]
MADVELVTAEKVLPIVKALLNITDATKDDLLNMLIEEMITRVEHYINDSPPLALKYAIARLCVSAYKNDFDDNGGRGVSQITEDDRTVVFEKVIQSVNAVIATAALDIMKDLHRYRKLAK